MKTVLFIFIIGLSVTCAYAQHSFIGIQTSPRKGMIHASMNPAELNHLHRNVEVNLFALGATVSNNALSFKDIIREEDLLDKAFNTIKGPVNLSAEAQVIGPSFGFKVDQWSFGFLSQAYVKANVIDLDSDLARAFTDGTFTNDFYETRINSPSTQRVYSSGWAELGFMAGREVWTDDNHSFSAGATFKFLIPAVYINMGMNGLQGTLTQTRNEFRLSNANGQLTINYPEDLARWEIEQQMLDRLSLSNISGFAMDLGITHQWRTDGITRLSSGLSLRNLGGMNLGSNQVEHNYSIQIPENEAFRLDLLDGDLDDIEDQLLNSGYFTQSSQTGKTRANPSPLVAAYTDMRVSRIFHVSVFSQFHLGKSKNQEQITPQNLFSISPRLTLGLFELYSPWTHYEVSGLTGGLGVRVNGFFVGSQSVLTGLLADTKQADVHLGFSMGFGKGSGRLK